MMRIAASRVMWMGRATVFCVGLAVTLAVVLGVATVALAAVPGDPFKLGQVNAIGKITQLAGATDGALLRIDNDSKGERATALDLRVEPGKTPLRVNSGARVGNFNSDRLDGKDSTSFFSGRTYIVSEEREGVGFGTTLSKTAFCDEGDNVLSGGPIVFPEDDLVMDAPATVGGNTENWTVVIRDNEPASKIVVKAVCADFPPLRP